MAVRVSGIRYSYREKYDEGMCEKVSGFAMDRRYVVNLENPIAMSCSRARSEVGYGGGRVSS